MATSNILDKVSWFESWGMSTIVPEEAGDLMHAYPNPFSDAVVIRLERPLLTSDRIRLLNVDGRVLREIHCNGTTEIRIERGDLPAGMYLIGVVRDGMQLGSTRVVLE
jgi:hypothetical protein